MIFDLNDTVLLDEKYLLERVLRRESQADEELGFSLFYSQSLALSFREKGEKIFVQITFEETSLSLIESHFSRNLHMCLMGFSEEWP